jgi:recombination protein RecA
MATKKSNSSSLASASDSLSKSINKMFKKSGFEMSFGLDDDSSAEVTDWIPTGCRPLDLAISNLPDRGGFPCGRISILWGPQQSGKSLLAMHAIASTQKLDGIAFYVDAEHSIHRGFAEAVGVDLDTLMYTEEQNAEIVFNLIEQCCIQYRQEFPDKKICMIVDSLAALVTPDNIDRGHEQAGYDTSLSKTMATSLKLLAKTVRETNVALICTNQARQNFERRNMFDNKFRQYGGQAAPHWASLCIFSTQAGAIKKVIGGIKREVGRVARLTTDKNRLGPPNVSMEIKIYYDRGIDDYDSWEKLCKKFSDCVYTGPYISYTSADGRSFKENGWKKFVKNVLEKHPDIADEIWLTIAEKMVVAYSSDSDEGEEEIDMGEPIEDDNE